MPGIVNGMRRKIDRMRRKIDRMRRKIDRMCGLEDNQGLVAADDDLEDGDRCPT